MKGIQCVSVQEAEEEVEKALEKWEKVKTKEIELIEKELLDYHPIEISEEEEQIPKKNKKIMSGIKKV